MALIVAAVFGVSLVVAGVALIYVPAALIVAGIAVAGGAYLIAEVRNT